MFQKYVEIGRVAIVNYGELAGKACHILEVLDENRVLVDGPEESTGVARQVIPLKRLNLTPLVTKVPRGARRTTLKKKVAAQGTMEKLAKINVTLKAEKRALKANMSDFDRFKAMCARKRVNGAIRKEYAKLKKTAKL